MMTDEKLSITEIPVEKYGLSEEIEKIVRSEAGERSDEEKKHLQTHFRNEISTHQTITKLRGDLEATRKQRSDLEAAVPTTLVMKERAEFYIRQVVASVRKHERAYVGCRGVVNATKLRFLKGWIRRCHEWA